MPDDTTPQDPPPETSPADEAPDSPTDAPLSQDSLEIERLTALVSEQESKIDGLKQQVETAVSRYRIALIDGAPELPEELIHGSSIEELDRAMESARKIVEKVASRIEARAPEARVPSGAPARRSADLSGLSPREKIMYAINKS